MLQISSLQNNRIKSLVKLSKRRERDQRRVTIVEGSRELTHLVQAGIVPHEVYVCPELLDGETRMLFQQLEARYPQASMTAVTPAVFEKIAYRAGGGLLTVIPYINRPLTALELSKTPFIVVIEGVEKPGNLGAILRTADAVGVDAVIVCAGATDLHNPNVVRASLGALFTLPIAEVATAELLPWLVTNHIQTVAADPAATTPYTKQNLAVPLAIIMGSEAEGLSATWTQIATASVKIPMYGAMDSLNLSVATAVLLYEALRQRTAAD